MDGAEACDERPIRCLFPYVFSCKGRRVGGRGDAVWKPEGVSLGGTVSSADLGGSSKYSNENFED